MDFKNLNEQIEETKNWLKKEYTGIRTGAASLAILDNVKVEAYGAEMPLNQVASLGVEDAKTLFVAPFDTSITKTLEKSLTDANLGLAMSVNESGIRLSFPDLTQERRVMLAKLAKDKLEDAKVTLRKHRDETWKEIQDKEKNKEISEDDKFSLKEKMEELVKEASDDLEKVFKAKEEEVKN